MTISSSMKKQFRTIGHNLKPVVTVAGNGLSENVLAEMNRALEDHELIKVKIAITERESRKAVCEGIQSKCKAELIQEIGKVALFYREARQPDTQKSNVR